MLRTRYLAGVALMAAGALGACQSGRSDTASRDSADTGDSTAAAGPQMINVTAKDFAFEAPARVPSGRVTFQLVNHGTELHHAQLVKLEDGKTLEDLAKAMKNPGPPPGWARFVGGPNAVPPGKTANATAVLEPGRYSYLCFVFGADKVPHFAKGMVREFEVVDSASTAGGLPAAETTIKMMDYGFELSGPLTPGRHTFLVTNEGPQPHEVAVLKLAPGKTLKDFGVWAETGMKGPPPAEPIGGVAALNKGERSTFTAELEPGNYGVMCFVPDAKDGKLHLEKGMMKAFKVS